MLIYRILQDENATILVDATFKAVPTYGYQTLTIMATFQDQV